MQQTQPLDGLLRPLRRVLLGRAADQRPHGQDANVLARPLLPPPSASPSGGSVRATPAARTSDRAAAVAEASPRRAERRDTDSREAGWRARRPLAETVQQDGPTLQPDFQQADLYSMQRMNEINPLETDVTADGLPLPEYLPMPEAKHEPRSWQQQQVAWKASQLKHLPLYFEDAPLERYGHSLGPLQPVWSTGQFYTQLLLLPYQVELEPPFESVYALGYARPGDPVPRLWYQFPISLRGTMSQISFWATNIATLP